MKGKLPNTFTLRPGKWKITFRDGRQEIVTSDGTMTVNLDSVAWIFQVFP